MILKASPFVLLCSAVGAQALELALPEGSHATHSSVTENSSYALPVGPYLDGILPVSPVDGVLQQQVWRVESSASTSQFMEPLRRQILAAGYEILLDCQVETCGGFDFRFGIDVVPAPDMYVNLADYRFASAVLHADSGAEAVSVLVSTSDKLAHIQVTHVRPGSDAGHLNTTLSAPPTSPTFSGASDAHTPQSLILTLEAVGRVVLVDLTFATGSSKLDEATFGSLEALAGYLAADDSRRIALVGHTDNVGNLANNIALSERRASAVRDRLISLGVGADQLEANGVGYLAPLASNNDESGRTLNRRVEAVLLEAAQ